MSSFFNQSVFFSILMRHLLLGLCVWLMAGTATAQTLKVTSPDKRLRLTFALDAQGTPSYALSYGKEALLLPSALGFAFKEQPALQQGFELLGSERSQADSSWTQPWGENKLVRDHHRQLLVHLQEKQGLRRKLDIAFRLFDDGMAFRYILPQQPGMDTLTIMDELTEFRFAQDHQSWWIWADYDTYEKLYNETPLSQAPWVATPFTLKTRSGLHLSVHEAALTDYSDMTLKQQEKGGLSFRTALVPWANGDKVRTSAPMQTPWRTLQVGRQAHDLVNSSLLVNLNEPCRLADVSWIKPMKYIGIWWEMHLGTKEWKEGARHAATTEEALRYIDFAAKHNVEGVVVEGWDAGWDKWGEKDAFDHMTPASDYDLERIAAYAKQKGIALIMHNETGGDIPSYEAHLEKAFAYYEKLGIHALKTGYAGGIYPRGEHHHGQFMVDHYRRVVELAAKHKLMLDVHEPIKPTGVRRTYPNMMTREGVRGMEWNGWSDGNPASHTVILPFTRMLAGPLDYTPGIFDVTYQHSPNRVPWNTTATVMNEARVHTTLAKQLALTVILYSPLQMASDRIENYERDPKAFRFIEDYVADCEESRALAGEIGKYVAIGRRAGQQWFVGVATNEEARTLSLPLDFLPKGKKYKATVYADAPGAGYRNNPDAYQVYELEVDARKRLDVQLPAGGGQAIRLEPLG